MSKFSMAESSKANFPMPAFQVAFTSNGIRQVPCVKAVTLTRYTQADDRMYFTSDDGCQAHCHSLNFFRSEEDAQRHIDFVYNSKHEIREKVF